MPRAERVLEHLRRAALAYVVLVLALILTFLAHQYVRETVKESRSAKFNEEVLAAQEALDRRMESYVDAMRGARGLFYASDSVEADEWSAYASGIDLEDRYEAIQALGYAKRLRPADRSAFEDELSWTFREEGRPDPTLRPEGQRDAYFPITYVEPLDEVNERLLGYDAYPRPEHRIAMSQARDTGEPRSTGKVYLFSEPSPGSKADLALEEGFVVYLPIYRQGEPTGTAVGRRSALDGFVAGAIDAEDFMRGLFDERESRMDFEVYDKEGLAPNDLLYDDDAVLRAGESREATNGLAGALAD